jgi:hypothetical protein
LAYTEFKFSTTRHPHQSNIYHPTIAIFIVWNGCPRCFV